MKELIKKVMIIIIMIVSLIAIYKLLELQDTKAYNNAVARCGSDSNVVVKHTNQGDRYYLCKVDK